MRARVILALALATLAGAAGLARADRPPQATKRFMRALLTGQRPWAEVIDPARGVFDLIYRTGEFATRRWGRHACDARAPLARVARQLGQPMDLDELGLSCRNRGDVHRCTLDAVGEDMPAWRFDFRATPTGLVLDAIAEINSVYNPADQERVLARLRARARPATCPP